jgi:hypothetical protein
MHGFESRNCLPRRVAASGSLASFDYGHTLLNFELRPRANFVAGFYGTDGTLLVGLNGWEVHTRDGKVERVAKAWDGSHERNFLDCVRSRNRPNADVEIGRLSGLLGHLGDASYRLGREVRFEPETETFSRDRE